MAWLIAAVGGCWAGEAPVPCCPAVGWPAVCRRTSSADVAVPLAASLMAAVGGCAEVSAVECVPPDAPGVGPEPTSLLARTLRRLSISLLQGPAATELMPSAHTAILTKMNAFVFIAFAPLGIALVYAKNPTFVSDGMRATHVASHLPCRAWETNSKLHGEFHEFRYAPSQPRVAGAQVGAEVGPSLGARG